MCRGVERVCDTICINGDHGTEVVTSEYTYQTECVSVWVLALGVGTGMGSETDLVMDLAWCTGQVPCPSKQAGRHLWMCRCGI